MAKFCRLSERQCWCSWVLRIACVAVPFAALFFEAGLNLQTRRNDYELIELNDQRNLLETELLKQNSLLSQVKPKDFLDGKATELGLQSPDVDQYKLVQYREVPKRAPAFRLDHMHLAPGSPPATPILRMEMAHRPESETPPPTPVAPIRPQTAVEPVVLPSPVVPREEIVEEDPELSYMNETAVFAQL